MNDSFPLFIAKKGKLVHMCLAFLWLPAETPVGPRDRPLHLFWRAELPPITLSNLFGVVFTAQNLPSGLLLIMTLKT